MRKSTAIVVVLAVFAVAALSGCQYFEKSSALIADGLDSYCDGTTALARDVIRAELAAELVAEGLEICLGCAGDATTACTGAHRPKTDIP